MQFETDVMLSVEVMTVYLVDVAKIWFLKISLGKEKARPSVSSVGNASEAILNRPVCSSSFHVTIPSSLCCCEDYITIKITFEYC